MPDYTYQNSLGHVPSYQASARPFLTGSLEVPANQNDPLEIEFQHVTRFIIITNTKSCSATNTPIRFGFSARGVKGTVDQNYGILNNGESFEAEFRVSRVYLLSDTSNPGEASVIAGITNIKSSELEHNWSGSQGIG